MSYGHSVDVVVGRDGEDIWGEALKKKNRGNH